MKYLSIILCLITTSVPTLSGMDSGWEAEKIKELTEHHSAEHYGVLTTKLRTILDAPNSLLTSAFAFAWVKEKAETGDVPLMYLHIRAKLQNNYETPNDFNDLITSMLILLIRVYQDNFVCTTMGHDATYQGTYHFLVTNFRIYWQQQDRFATFKRKCYWWFKKYLRAISYQDAYKKALEWFSNHENIVPQPAWICPAYQDPTSKSYSIIFQDVPDNLSKLYQTDQIKALSEENRNKALELFKETFGKHQKWDEFFKNVQRGGDDRIGN